MQLLPRAKIAGAALLLCVGCGGGGRSTTSVASGVSARLINASSGSQAISLVATAHGATTTIGPETGGKTSAYSAVPYAAGSGGMVQTTFTAYAGTTVLATVIAQTAPGSKKTIVYQAAAGGGSPVLVPVPDSPPVNSSGSFTFNAINVSANFGGGIDVYFARAAVPTFDEAPNLTAIGLGQVSGTRHITAAVYADWPNYFLDITPAGSKITVLSSVPFPNSSFTASGNFSIYLVDTDSGGSQILLVDDTGS